MSRRAACAALLSVLFAPSVLAETVRVATFNASLNRKEAGILVADLLKSDDQQIHAVAETIRTVRPDIILINEIDYDAGGEALRLFMDLLRQPGEAAGIDYPHYFVAPSNTGLPSGLDLNGDGKTAGPADAFGFGYFSGQYGMALLSRLPIAPEASKTFQTLLWRDFPGANMPIKDGKPYPSAQAREAMRLSSKSHWDVAIETEAGVIRIFASHPTPPVFDGPEDANGKRNRDEILFWHAYIEGTALDGDAGRHSYDGRPFIVLGDLNADPVDGDGLHDGILTLLDHPDVQDPLPNSAGAVEAGRRQGGTNESHLGDPALDTADWADDGPGNLRVDYVLPSKDFRILDAGVFWPMSTETGHDLLSASDHRLVWVDIALD